MFLRKTPPNDGHDTTSLKETLNESAEGGGGPGMKPHHHDWLQLPGSCTGNV